ncbi:MAG: alpha/beta fold hydrolase [Anaerolineae bacterium]|nr:alpha/beta fold hydrolase [Anaerolineae bacterium]
MPQPEHLDPSAYAAGGGAIGVLLIHGFPGSAAETRPMGEYLADRGLTVRCPLLPGHGTRPEDLIGVRWQAWAAEAEAALVDLQARCREVFVGGLSLGSLLTLWLGAGHAEITGLVPMAPAVKIDSPLVPLTVALRHVIKYVPPAALPKGDLADPKASDRIWCYDKTPMWGAGEVYRLQREVLQALPEIRQPVLIFQGRLDTSVDPQAAQILYDRIGSADKELVWLEQSGHNLLVDAEREKVWARSYEWMMAHTEKAEGPGPSA